MDAFEELMNLFSSNAFYGFDGESDEDESSPGGGADEDDPFEVVAAARVQTEDSLEPVIQENVAAANMALTGEGGGDVNELIRSIQRMTVELQNQNQLHQEQNNLMSSLLSQITTLVKK